MIGAGLMGAGIAEVCVRAGMRVRVIDSQPKSLRARAPGIDAELARLVQRRDLTEAERRKRMVLTTFSTAIDGLGGMDLVIEAVPERREVKDKVLARRSRRPRRRALIATNTSLVLARGARAGGRPRPSASSDSTGSTRRSRCRSSRWSGAA